MQEYSKRGVTKFNAEILANNLAAHTIHIIKNKKYFSDEVQQAMSPEIIKLVLDLAGKVNRANRIFISHTDEQQAIEAHKKRIELEDEAIEMCDILLDRITTLRLAFHLKMSKAAPWARMTKETRAGIKSWQNYEKRELARLVK